MQQAADQLRICLFWTERSNSKPQFGHQVEFIKNKFEALATLGKWAVACAFVRRVPEERETLAGRGPGAASWLRSAALRAQAAVAQGRCHVVGIESSHFHFPVKFFFLGKNCARWDRRHPAVLMWVSRHDEIADPSLISTSSARSTFGHLLICWVFFFML